MSSKPRCVIHKAWKNCKPHTSLNTCQSKGRPKLTDTWNFFPLQRRPDNRQSKLYIIISLAFIILLYALLLQEPPLLRPTTAILVVRTQNQNLTHAILPTRCLYTAYPIPHCCPRRYGSEAGRLLGSPTSRFDEWYSNIYVYVYKCSTKQKYKTS